MKKNAYLAAGLALALLAGCSGGKTAEPAADADDLAWQVVSVKRTDPLFTVDGEGVPAEEYLFWLSNAIAEEQYYGNVSTDATWAETFPDGSNTVETLKEEALSAAKLYQVVRNKAAEMGIAVTDDEREQLANDLAGAAEQMGGDDAYLEWLESQCISKEGFTTLNLVYYLNTAIRTKLAEEGKLTVSEADIDDFLESQGIYAAKHILISTRHANEDGSFEPFTDEERAAALAQAQDMCEQLKAAADKEKLFDELMNEFSDDGRGSDGKLYYPDGYDFVYTGQMVPEFEAGAKTLSVGGISEPIETTYGYHIILRIAPNRDTAREQCNDSYKYSKILEQWQEEAQVSTTRAYDELDPNAFYNRLIEVCEARQIARALQTTPSSAPLPSETPAEGE